MNKKQIISRLLLLRNVAPAKDKNHTTIYLLHIMPQIVKVYKTTQIQQKCRRNLRPTTNNHSHKPIYISPNMFVNVFWCRFLSPSPCVFVYRYKNVGFIVENAVHYWSDEC